MRTLHLEAAASTSVDGKLTPVTEFLLFGFGTSQTTQGPVKLNQDLAKQVMKRYEARTKARGGWLDMDWFHLSRKDSASLEDRRSSGRCKLELRNDGIWVTDIRPTSEAAQWLEADKVRSYSPVITVNDRDELTGVLQLSLTNIPAMDDAGLLAADEIGIPDADWDRLQAIADDGCLELAAKTGSGWVTIHGTHVYATPGQSVDFKNLKSTEGGQKAASNQGKQSVPAQTKVASAAGKSSFVRDPTKLEVDEDPFWDAKRTPTGEPEDKWVERTSKELNAAVTAEQRNAISAYTGQDYIGIRMTQRMSKDDVRQKLFEDVPKLGDKAATVYDRRIASFAAKDTKANRKKFDEWYDEKKKQADTVESALKAAPKSPGTVYRGLGTVDHQKLINQDSFETDGITSTSRSWQQASRFATPNPPPALLVLKQKSAVAIESASAYDAEKELALPKGVKFNVTKRTMWKPPNSKELVMLVYAEEA